jgi:hypothetical protein
MYVLTLTVEYEETSVVGVFETMDDVVAAKEAHPDLHGDFIWLSWEIPQSKRIYAPGTVEPDVEQRRKDFLNWARP